MGKAQIHEIRGGGNTQDLLWEGDYQKSSNVSDYVGDFTDGALDVETIAEYDAILIKATVNITKKGSTANSVLIKFFAGSTKAGDYDFQVSEAPWEGRFAYMLFIGKTVTGSGYASGHLTDPSNVLKFAYAYLGTATFHFKVFGIKF